MHARALNQQSPESQHQMVAFQLGGKTYALPLRAVVQIIPMVAITPLPQTHAAIEGVMNFRGRAVPIIHMRRYLGLPERALGLHTPILLVSTDGHTHGKSRTLGLIVDQVTEVLALPPEQVAGLDEILPEGLGSAAVLKGLMHTDEGAVLLLDLAQLFAADQVTALQQVANRALAEQAEPASGEGHDAASELEPEMAEVGARGRDDG